MPAAGDPVNLTIGDLTVTDGVTWEATKMVGRLEVTSGVPSLNNEPLFLRQPGNIIEELVGAEITQVWDVDELTVTTVGLHPNTATDAATMVGGRYVYDVTFADSDGHTFVYPFRFVIDGDATYTANPIPYAEVTTDTAGS